MSPKNLEILATDGQDGLAALIESRSADADLVLVGLTAEHLDRGAAFFSAVLALREVLFVSAQDQVLID